MAALIPRSENSTKVGGEDYKTQQYATKLKSNHRVFSGSL